MTRSAMKAVWVLLVVCLAACVESNPQPSPMAGVDTTTPAEDTGAAMDVTNAEVVILDTVDMADTCVPICEDEDGPFECGDDGCGGSCGDCAVAIGGWIHNCVDGACVAKLSTGMACEAFSECWSGVCVETWMGPICVETCVAECPDGWTCEGYSRFAPTILFVCVPICPPNCDGKECGDDGCGGTCGDCPWGEFCIDGECVCPDDCTGFPCDGQLEGGCCDPCGEGLTCIEGECVSEEEDLPPDCEDWKACTVDGECVKTKAGFCGCWEGGTSTAVKAHCLEAWLAQFEGEPVDCNDMVVCDFTLPFCVQGHCVLLTPGCGDDGDDVPNYTDNCPCAFNPFQVDTDGDGMGDVCDSDDDNDAALDEFDCVPTDPQIYPGAPEVCDGKDNDCDGEVDEGITSTEVDALSAAGCNQDGVCVGVVQAVCNIENPGQWSCDYSETFALGYAQVEDGDPTLCDGLDNDCDGETDEGC